MPPTEWPGGPDVLTAHLRDRLRAEMDRMGVERTATAVAMAAATEAFILGYACGLAAAVMDRRGKTEDADPAGADPRDGDRARAAGTRCPPAGGPGAGGACGRAG